MVMEIHLVECIKIFMHDDKHTWTLAAVCSVVLFYFTILLFQLNLVTRTHPGSEISFHQPLKYAGYVYFD